MNINKKIYVIKKDGNKQLYDGQKILNAIQKSADRALYQFTEHEKQRILEIVEEQLEYMGVSEISVLTMHSMVENALDDVTPIVAKQFL